METHLVPWEKMGKEVGTGTGTRMGSGKWEEQREGGLFHYSHLVDHKLQRLQSHQGWGCSSAGQNADRLAGRVRGGWGGGIIF